MASIFSQLMTSQQVGIGKVVVGKAPDPDKNKTGITVMVTVFFDGTLNNRYNTAARLNKLSGADRYGGAGTSYANFYSNVSILETLNKKEGAYQKRNFDLHRGRRHGLHRDGPRQPQAHRR